MVDGLLWLILRAVYTKEGGGFFLVISMVAMIPTSVCVAAAIKQLSMARLVSPSLIPTARPPTHLSRTHRNSSSNTHITEQKRMVCGRP